MHVEPWMWGAFVAFILAMLAIDLFVFHRDAHEARPRLADGLRLLDGGVHVLGARGAHALDGHGMAGSEGKRADPHRPCRVSLHRSFIVAD